MSVCVWCVAVFTVLQLQAEALDPDKLVFLRELEVTTKRSVESLPDTIPLRVSSKEGDFQLLLTRNKDIDETPTEFVVKTRDSEKVYQLDQRGNGFYHDYNNNAVVHVQLKEQQGQMKRKYSGTFTHGSKAYELQPVESTDRLERELQERAEEATGSHLHVLRHQHPGEYISDTILSDRQRRAPVLDKRGSGNSANNNNNDRGQNNKMVKVDEILPDKERKPDLPGPNLGSDSSKKDEIQLLTALLRKLKEREEEKEASSSGKSKRDVDGGVRSRRSTIEAKSDMDNQNYKLELVFMIDDQVYEEFLKMEKSANEAIARIGLIFKNIFNGIYMLYRRINKNQAGFTITPILKRIELSQQAQGYCSRYKLTGNGKIDGREGIEDALYKEERASKAQNKWMNIDHIMVWTGRDIIEGGKPSLGFSPVGKICEPYFGYSLIRYKGFYSWFAAAHELAHNCGARHDGVDNDCDANKYMMSVNELSAKEASLPFSFSSCSINEMKGFLAGHTDGIGKTCLIDDPCNTQSVSISLSRSIGQLISIENQCLLFGHSSKKAVYDESCNPVLSNICGELKCKLKGDCTSPSAEFKALPGTPCGRKKWCMWGRCVSRNSKDYHDPSGLCDKKRKKRALIHNQPPTGCQDQSHQCPIIAEQYPFTMFTDPKYRQYCPFSCYKYGLFFDFENPCVSPGLYDVKCPGNPNKAIRYEKLCDGRNDCGDNSDEDGGFCDIMSIKLPFCKDPRKVFCPRSFKEPCIDPGLACNGQVNCPKGEDERASWCKMLPKTKCKPGFVYCPHNPSVCCYDKR